MKMNSVIIYPVLFTLIFPACRKNPAEPTATNVVRITDGPHTIVAGETIQLSAEAEMSDGQIVDVTRDGDWSTSPGLAGEIAADGLFRSFSAGDGTETVQFAYRNQTATTEITIARNPTVFTTRPAFLYLNPGQSHQFEGIATYLSPGSPIAFDFLTSEINWSISQGGEFGSISPSGFLRTESTIAAPETVKVVGGFGTVSVFSDVVILPEGHRFEMVAIPAGSFTMGSASGVANEQPEHDVFLAAYEIGKYEINNAQYVSYLNRALRRGDIRVENGQVFPRTGPYMPFFQMSFTNQPGAPEALEYEDGGFQIKMGTNAAFLPVTRLNWFGAASFCDFYGLRLPTEAEWERAARADAGLEYGTADGTISHDLANYFGTGGLDQYEGLANVGSFPPNPLGLFDMAGNVEEYVFDEYASDFYRRSPASNPIGPGSASPTGRLNFITILRGGGAMSAASSCSATRRRAYNNSDPGHDDPTADIAHAGFGFRVARSGQP